MDSFSITDKQALLPSVNKGIFSSRHFFLFFQSERPRENCLRSSRVSFSGVSFLFSSRAARDGPVPRCFPYVASSRLLAIHWILLELYTRGGCKASVSDFPGLSVQNWQIIKKELAGRRLAAARSVSASAIVRTDLVKMLQQYLQTDEPHVTGNRCERASCSFFLKYNDYLLLQSSCGCVATYVMVHCANSKSSYKQWLNMRIT